MIKLGSALFAHKECVIEVTGSKVNKSGIANMYVSEYRHGIMGSPKISIAAAFIDWMCIYPGIAIYESDDGIYIENGDAKAICTGNVINYSPEWKYQIDGKYELAPLVAYELSRHGENLELKTVFKEIMDSWNSTGLVDEGSIYKFCDSFYYGCAKDKTLDATDALTDEEIQAGFRSGLFTESKLLSDLCKNLQPSVFASAATPKKKRKKKDEGSFIKECREGMYHIPYEWPEEMQQFIVKPEFLDSFESTPEFEEIVRKLKFRATRILERMDMGLTRAEAIGKDSLNIMILGKPGTGKTTLAYALSAATGMPVCTTVHSKHSDEDEYEGKTKIIDGKPAFVETNSLKFHTNGGIDINEEINLEDPSVAMGGMGQKLEYPYIVKRNGYETVVRHPLNVIIATMNVGTNGSNPLNQALANRFKSTYILDDPTRETFIGILEKSSKQSRDVCEWVYNAYESVVQYLKDPDVNEEEVCQNLSIRTCLGAIENMEEGQEPVRALINSIVGAIAVVDLELARRVQHERIESLPNPTFSL